MKKTNRVFPKGYVKASSDIYSEIAKLVNAKTIPRNGSIIKDAGLNTYYWKIQYDDPSKFASLDDFIHNGIFAFELPNDPDGGMLWGELDCSIYNEWVYSTYSEAAEDNFGRDERSLPDGSMW